MGRRSLRKQVYGRWAVNRMKANTKRQAEFDYIKTLAIFFMVIIHVLEEISAYGAYDVMPAGFWKIWSSSVQVRSPRLPLCAQWASASSIPAAMSRRSCSGGASEY